MCVCWEGRGKPQAGDGGAVWKARTPLGERGRQGGGHLGSSTRRPVKGFPCGRGSRPCLRPCSRGTCPDPRPSLGEGVAPSQQGRAGASFGERARPKSSKGAVTGRTRSPDTGSKEGRFQGDAFGYVLGPAQTVPFGGVVNTGKANLSAGS